MKRFSKYTFFALAAGIIFLLLCSSLFLKLPSSAFPLSIFSWENTILQGNTLGTTDNSNLSGASDNTDTSNNTGTSNSNHSNMVDSLPSAASQSLKGLCVVLDAGHGGNDAGAIWNDLYEKDLTLLITQKLAQLLADYGCTVITTREDDTYVSLQERVQIAQTQNADLFISIHLNSFEDDSGVNGIETYAAAESNENCSLLANALHAGIIEETGAKDRGVKTDSNFYVLRHSTIPSCLIEVGFITSEIERPLLQNNAYQEEIISGIFQGVLHYWEEIR